MFGDAALLPILLVGTRMHLGTLVALAVAVAGWVLMSFTIIGFQLRVLGQAPAAARFAGFRAARMVWLCLLLSGRLAGLAGLFEVARPIGQLVPSISPGYGFTALLHPFLGRLHPPRIVPPGLPVALPHIGRAPAAARFAGFSAARMVWLCLLLSVGLAGLAGLFEVAGPIGQLVPSISPGYGFTAIIVAFLGRLHPLGIVLSGLLVALSYIGGETAQVEVGLPQAVTGVFQGLLLFFLLASDFLVRYRLRLRPAVTPAPRAQAAE